MEEEEKPNRRFLIASVFTANLLLTTEGTMLTWPSPVLKILESNSSDNPFGYSITSSESAWMGSLISLGTTVGPYLYPLGTPWIGRRWMLLSLGIQFTLVLLTFTISNKLIYFYIARIISGIAAGMMWAVVPTYISEISEDVNRGLLGSTLTIFEVFGYLLSYLVGPYLPLMWFNLSFAGIPLLFIILFPLFIVETPQWLLLQGNVEKAKKNLMRLRSSTKVDREFEEMKELLATKKTGNIIDVFRFKHNAVAFALSMALIGFQQLSGNQPFLTYTQTIFEFSERNTSALYAILIGIAGFIGTFVTPIFVERYGRKGLLFTSALVMGVSEAIFGIYHWSYFHSPTIPLICLMVYMFSYILGYGILAFTVMAELSASEVSSIISACQASGLGAFGFVLTVTFTQTVELIGIHGIFFCYATSNFIAVVFTYFCLPETKGLSAKQIQIMLETYKIC